jgi:hypothetical protein
MFLQKWAGPEDRIETAAELYAEDLWADQGVRPYVWIEKAALVNLVEPACMEWQVPCFAVRGYNSISEMYEMGKEFGDLIDEGVTPVVLYLGDHDPSGINMPRVAQRDLSMFAGEEIEVRRLALNLDQVRQLRLPPNPAKRSDQRYGAYVEEFDTDKSWELDALDPPYVDQLLRGAISGYVDKTRWKAAKARQKKNQDLLTKVAQNWDAIARGV